MPRALYTKKELTELWICIKLIATVTGGISAVFYLPISCCLGFFYGCLWSKLLCQSLLNTSRFALTLRCHEVGNDVSSTLLWTKCSDVIFSVLDCKWMPEISRMGSLKSQRQKVCQVLNVIVLLSRIQKCRTDSWNKKISIEPNCSVRECWPPCKRRAAFINALAHLSSTVSLWWHVQPDCSDLQGLRYKLCWNAKGKQTPSNVKNMTFSIGCSSCNMS